MGALAIREKLQEYIRIADDKKVKAIYTIIESDLQEYEWWRDEKLVAILDAEYEQISTGKIKALTVNEFKKKVNKISKVENRKSKL